MDSKSGRQGAWGLNVAVTEGRWAGDPLRFGCADRIWRLEFGSERRRIGSGDSDGTLLRRLG